MSGSWERNFLDLPGFGGTPPLDGAGGLPELADWLVGAVRELVGTRQFAILASSLGGLLARHVIAQSPGQVLGVALIAPVVEPDVARRALPDRSVIERDDDLIHHSQLPDRNECRDIAVRQVAKVMENILHRGTPGCASQSDAMDRLSQQYFWARPSPRHTIKGPETLIVTVEQDHIISSEDQFLAAHRLATSQPTLLSSTEPGATSVWSGRDTNRPPVRTWWGESS